MHFLIRTKENRISGPFAKEDVVARMLRGELREVDEICPGNGYWIYLHEREESIRMLGTALARNEGIHDDSTETDTETVTQPLVVPVAHDPDGSLPPIVVGTMRTSPPAVPTRNRPESVRLLRLMLWVFAFLIALILLRIYRVSSPV